MDHHHRSSIEPNKNFKGRNAGHKSKREIDRKVAGKINKTNERGNIKNAGRKDVHSKQDLRNTKKQIIKNRRDQLISQKRGIGSEPAPKMVAIINLGGAKVNVGAARTHILDYLGESKHNQEDGPITVRSKKYKTRFCFFQSTDEIYCIMDIAKVADILLFVVSEDGITEQGKKIISIIKAQGMGSVFAVMQGVNTIEDKKKLKLLHKNILHQMQHEFPTIARVLPLDKKEDADQVIRFLDVLHPFDTEWRKERSFVIGDKFHFQKVSNTLTGGFQALGDEEKGTLAISGFLRGGSRMNANLLVHIPYFGDYQVIKIVSADDPCPKERSMNKMDDESNNEERILHQFDPEQRDTLESENIPDPLDGEQNWPEEQDLKDDSFEDIENAGKQLKKKKKKVPKGTSSYQTSWIPDTESSEGDSEGSYEEVDENEIKTSANKNTKQTKPTNKKQPVNEKDDIEDDEDEDEDSSGMEDDNKNRNTIRFDGEAQQIDSSSEAQMSIQESHLSIRIKDRSNHTLEELEKEQLEWPDEVQVPSNQRASVRFQRYRGLKSFRTSAWDPKESLPEDYSRIFQFENWRGAVNRSKKKTKEGAMPGQYVTIYIANFPEKLVSKIDMKRPLIVGGLLKHEHKYSLLTFNVNKHASYPVPICSKEDLVFCFGWKRIQVNANFSEGSPGFDKQKFCKFLHAGVNANATCYGPITFGSCPLVVFKETKDGLHLAATGSYVGCDPDIIVVKKIILTGNPYKIHKRICYVRNMFIFPEDIRWFKPVELWTKHGKIGNIKEPHGTHGLMKCIFDNQITHQDTVCMSLYRRVFPKWTTKELTY